MYQRSVTPPCVYLAVTAARTWLLEELDSGVSTSVADQSFWSTLWTLGVGFKRSIPSSLSVYSVVWTPSLANGRSSISRVPLLGGRDWALTWRWPFLSFGWRGNLCDRLSLHAHILGDWCQRRLSLPHITQGNGWAHRVAFRNLFHFWELL